MGPWVLNQGRWYKALDLMWQFMGLANPVLDRCWDGDETVAGAFKADNLGAIACTASRDPRRLADRAFEQLTQNAHGQYEDLIRALTPALGQEGLERLKQRMVEYSNTPVADLPQAHRPRIHRRYLRPGCNWSTLPIRHGVAASAAKPSAPPLLLRSRPAAVCRQPRCASHHQANHIGRLSTIA